MNHAWGDGPTLSDEKGIGEQTYRGGAETQRKNREEDFAADYADSRRSKVVCSG